MLILLRIYIVLTIFLVLDAAMYFFYRISLPGHVSDWLLFWVWVILTAVVIVIYLIKRWVKAHTISYATFMVFATVLMVGPLRETLVSTFSERRARYKLNDRLELQEYSLGIMAPPKIIAIKSFWIYERIIGVTDCELEVNDVYYRIHDAESINLLSVQDTDSLRVAFKFPDGIVTRTMR